MGFSATLRPNLSATSSLHVRKLSSVRPDWKHKTVPLSAVTKRRGHSVLVVKSVLNNGKPSISDNGPTEPARVLLERLFAQTQKLEQGMNRDGEHLQDFHQTLDLETLGSDMRAALTALKKKESDLQDVERTVVWEQTQLRRAKDELEQRETEIAAASSKHEKLEGELKRAYLAFASQASLIEDLKLQLKERDKEIAAAQSALSIKEMKWIK